MVPNLGIFIISRYFAIRQIQGCWFQIWQYHFQIAAPKYGNLTFLVPNLRIFIFSTKLCNKANSRVLISSMTMVFQNCCPKHLKKAFFGSKFKNSNFCTALCNYTIWRVFFSFWMKLYSFTILSVLIKNLIIVFVKLQPKNT